MRNTAPVAGITGRSEHSEGTLITTDAAGSLLTTINQVNPIWVRFSLAESDLAKIPTGRLGGAGVVEVQLFLPDGKLLLHGRAEIVRHQLDAMPPGVGARFLDISYEAQELIDRLVAPDVQP